MRKRCIALLLCLLTLAALTGCGESSAKAVTSNGVECYRVDGVCYPAVFGEPQLTGEEIMAALAEASRLGLYSPRFEVASGKQAS